MSHCTHLLIYKENLSVYSRCACYYSDVLLQHSEEEHQELSVYQITLRWPINQSIPGQNAS